MSKKDIEELKDDELIELYKNIVDFIDYLKKESESNDK